MASYFHHKCFCSFIITIQLFWTNQVKKGLPMKQYQTKVSSLTRDIMILDLMNTMGWTRSRAIAAIEELEQAHLVYFPEAGGLKLKVVGGY